MKELALNSDQKAKVAYLNEKTSETFQDLTLILIMPVFAQFNDIVWIILINMLCALETWK